jgi:hypothetical protein
MLRLWWPLFVFWSPVRVAASSLSMSPNLTHPSRRSRYSFNVLMACVYGTIHFAGAAPARPDAQADPVAPAQCAWCRPDTAFSGCNALALTCCDWIPRPKYGFFRDALVVRQSRSASISRSALSSTMPSLWRSIPPKETLLATRNFERVTDYVCELTSDKPAELKAALRKR